MLRCHLIADPLRILLVVRVVFIDDFIEGGCCEFATLIALTSVALSIWQRTAMDASVLLSSGFALIFAMAMLTVGISRKCSAMSSVVCCGRRRVPLVLLVIRRARSRRIHHS